MASFPRLNKRNTAKCRLTMTHVFFSCLFLAMTISLSVLKYLHHLNWDNNKNKTTRQYFDSLSSSSLSERLDLWQRREPEKPQQPQSQQQPQQQQQQQQQQINEPIPSSSLKKHVTDLTTIQDKVLLDQLKANAKSKAQPIPSVFKDDILLFNPEEFRTGDKQKYVNLPINDCTQGECQARLQEALQQSQNPLVLPAYGLRHVAHPPGKDVVMGLAAYPRGMSTFVLLVGSLRATGYDGHIILGVHAEIPPEEEDYLKSMDVTYYYTNFTQCDDAILTQADRRNQANGGGGGSGNTVRAKCSPGMRDLKLEWGRFEMSRQWLRECQECTGWAMTMDTRDAFFQSNPFAVLGDPNLATHDLLFVEEIAPHTDPFYGTHEDNLRHFTLDTFPHKFYKAHTDPCYGKDHQIAFGKNRPVLCSGTVIGTRNGLHRFLSVLVHEFRTNNKRDNEKCRSPHMTDQWMMNYLYYQGRFGFPEKTKTLPFGTGPVLTAGKACINRAKPKPPNHSAQDIIEFDLVHHHQHHKTTNATGLIVNLYEPVDSVARIAPVVHQFDRCVFWIKDFLDKHGLESHKNLKLPWKHQY